MCKWVAGFKQCVFKDSVPECLVTPTVFKLPGSFLTIFINGQPTPAKPLPSWEGQRASPQIRPELTGVPSCVEAAVATGLPFCARGKGLCPSSQRPPRTASRVELWLLAPLRLDFQFPPSRWVWERRSITKAGHVPVIKPTHPEGKSQQSSQMSQESSRSAVSFPAKHQTPAPHSSGGVGVIFCIGYRREALRGPNRGGSSNSEVQLPRHLSCAKHRAGCRGVAGG